MESLTCAKCGNVFQLAEDVAKKYPGWQPKLCRSCYLGPKRQTKPELNLTTEEVLGAFTEGPNTGVFTDGSCEPNPGQGGWGVVKVVDGKVVDERHGHVAATTSNRMELTALIEAFKMLAPDEQIDVYTDSELCFNTMTKWAPGWQNRGWRRGKKGKDDIKNLDLVKEVYALALSHPGATVRWTKAHEGCRWNEYADSLSTAYTRDRV
jgi:ribonuclease HI